jgi:hypothetical protein
MVTKLPGIGNQPAPFRSTLYFTLRSLFPDEIIILLHAMKGQGIANGRFSSDWYLKTLQLP